MDFKCSSMPTQEGSNDISVSYAHSQSPVRLLELLPSKPHSSQLLQNVLTEYNPSLSIVPRVSDAPSKSSLEQSIPLSDAEFTNAWKDVDAFELDGIAFRLAAKAALPIFKIFITICKAEGIDIWSSGGFYIRNVITAIMADDEGKDWPRETYEA